ncbi:hypothetical protein HWD87_13175 [Enterococcus gallinarum]|nr:hypothetical protein [Enterococcus gallinarum]
MKEKAISHGRYVFLAIDHVHKISQDPPAQKGKVSKKRSYEIYTPLLFDQSKRANIGKDVCRSFDEN